MFGSQVMFGTTAGKVIVMSASGTMVAQVIIHEGLEICYLGWSSERFHLVEQESGDVITSGDIASSSKCLVLYELAFV